MQQLIFLERKDWTVKGLFPLQSLLLHKNNLEAQDILDLAMDYELSFSSAFFFLIA